MTLILGLMVTAVLAALGVVFDRGMAQKVWAAIGVVLLVFTVFIMVVGTAANAEQDAAAAASRAEDRAYAAEVAARPLNYGLPLANVLCE